MLLHNQSPRTSQFGKWLKWRTNFNSLRFTYENSWGTEGESVVCPCWSPPVYIGHHSSSESAHGNSWETGTECNIANRWKQNKTENSRIVIFFSWQRIDIEVVGLEMGQHANSLITRCNIHFPGFTHVSICMKRSQMFVVNLYYYLRWKIRSTATFLRKR